MLPTLSIPSAVERVILKKESVSELVKSGSYAMNQSPDPVQPRVLLSERNQLDLLNKISARCAVSSTTITFSLCHREKRFFRFDWC